MVLDTRDRELKNMTMEDDDEDDARHVLRDHRHYDEFMENEPVGKRYLARMTGVPSARRRHHARLGVSRVAFLEPIGASRESHYQQRRASHSCTFIGSPACGACVALNVVRYTPPVHAKHNDLLCLLTGYSSAWRGMRKARPWRLCSMASRLPNGLFHGHSRRHLLPMRSRRLRCV